MRLQAFLIAGGCAASLATNPTLAQNYDPGPWWHTNGAPSLRIVTPQEGQTLLIGRDIHICAVSMNFTDAVSRVEFFAGTSGLGEVTNAPVVGGHHLMDFRERFSCITWTNAEPGPYALTAVATDLAGNSITSPPVRVTVTTNLPPVVRIIEPHNDALILGPTNVDICASAFDPDGSLASVSFYEGGNLLGMVTNTPVLYITNNHGIYPIRKHSYCLTWSNAVPGSYTLTAVATDNQGAMSTSEPVAVTVVTNLPPVVRIVRPEDGSRLLTPATLHLQAVASDPDGSVTEVEFFSGTQSLGVATSGISVTNHEGKVQTFYSLTWSNVPPGSYTLTATATDNDGETGVSAPISVTVVAPPAPSVTIVYPKDGARFVAPATVHILAAARHFTNRIATVEFFAGTESLGVKTNSWWPTFVWKNVTAGAYSLTAIAADTGGIRATSAPVSITVTTNSPH